MQVTIDLTGFLAIWGAVLSTLAIAWDVYKWRTSGPQISMRLSTNMQSISVPEYEGKTLISATVTNRGDRPTTITHFAIAYYDSWWKSFIKKRRTKAAIVATPSLAQRLPFELKAGAEWIGLGEQNQDISRWAKEGWLYVEIYHSHADKPVRKRVVLTNDESK